MSLIYHVWCCDSASTVMLTLKDNVATMPMKFIRPHGLKEANTPSLHPMIFPHPSLCMSLMFHLCCCVSANRFVLTLKEIHILQQSSCNSLCHGLKGAITPCLHPMIVPHPSLYMSLIFHLCSCASANIFMLALNESTKITTTFMKFIRACLEVNKHTCTKSNINLNSPPLLARFKFQRCTGIPRHP